MAQAPQSTEFTPIAQESRYACTGGKDGVVWMVFQSHKCRVTSHHRPANPCQQAGNTGMELRPTRRTSRGKEGWHQAGICFWHEGGSLPQQYRPTTASRLKILEEAEPQELLFWSCIYSKLSPGVKLHHRLPQALHTCDAPSQLIFNNPNYILSMCPQFMGEVFSRLLKSRL